MTLLEEDHMSRKAEPDRGAPAPDETSASLFEILDGHLFLWERNVPVRGGEQVDKLSILPPPKLFTTPPQPGAKTDLTFEILGGEARVFLGRARSFLAADRRVIVAEIAFICPDIVRDGVVTLHLVAPDRQKVTLLLETTPTADRQRVVWLNGSDTRFYEVVVSAAPQKSLREIIETDVGESNEGLDVASCRESRDKATFTIRIGQATFTLLRWGTLQESPFIWKPGITPGGNHVEIRLMRGDGAAFDHEPKSVADLTQFLLETTFVRHHYRRALAADERLRALASLSPEAHQPRATTTERRLILLMKDVVRALAQRVQGTTKKELDADDVLQIIDDAFEGDTAALQTVTNAVGEALDPNGAAARLALVSFPLTIATLDSFTLRPADIGRDESVTPSTPLTKVWRDSFVHFNDGLTDLVKHAATSGRDALPKSTVHSAAVETGSVWQTLPYRLRIAARTAGQLDMGAGAKDDDPVLSRILSDTHFDPAQGRLHVDAFFCNPISWLLEAKRRLGSKNVQGAGAIAFENLLNTGGLTDSVMGHFSRSAPPFILDLTDADLLGWEAPIPHKIGLTLGNGIADADVGGFFSPLTVANATDLAGALAGRLEWAGFERLGFKTAGDFRGLMVKMQKFRDAVTLDAEMLPENCPHDLGAKPARLGLPIVTAKTKTGERIIDEWTWPKRLGHKSDAAVGSPEVAGNNAFLRRLHPDRDPFGRKETIKRLSAYAVQSKGAFSKERVDIGPLGNDLAIVWASVTGTTTMFRQFIAYLLTKHQGLPPDDRVAKLIEAL